MMLRRAELERRLGGGGGGWEEVLVFLEVLGVRKRGCEGAMRREEVDLEVDRICREMLGAVRGAAEVVEESTVRSMMCWVCSRGGGEVKVRR